MKSIAEVLSGVDHNASLEERINQISSAIAAEYMNGNRLLEHNTYYVFNVFGIPSIGAMTFTDDFDARIKDMKDYCLWCGAHGVTETIHIGEVWQTATNGRPSQAPDRWESLFVIGIGQTHGGAVCVPIPIDNGNIPQVKMMPRGDFGTFELLAPSVVVDKELRRQSRSILNDYDVRVFANFIMSTNDDGTFDIDPFGHHFGIWHPIYPDQMPDSLRLDH